MGINLDKIPIAIVHKSIYQLFDESSLGDIIGSLEQKYHASSDHFPEPQSSEIISVSKTSKKQLIEDNIDSHGNINLDIAGLEFGVTFLAGRPPKSYIKSYLDISSKYQANLTILIEDNHGNHVDLLLGIKKADNSLFKRGQRIEFQGETINIVGVEDLIAMKLYAGGAKDLADVQGILEVSGEIINRNKLMPLVRKFGGKAVNTLKGLL